MVMQIISRADAKAAGLKRYFTAKVCRNGHMAERYASDGQCIECAREADRKRHAEHPERNREYYAANRERLREQSREGARRRFFADPKKVREYGRRSMRKWRAANPGSQLKAKFGLTYEQYTWLAATQLGVCQCCGRKCTHGRRLAVDHKDLPWGNGKFVRGLLCSFCNKNKIGPLEKLMSPVAIHAAAMAEPSNPWLNYLDYANQRLAAHRMGIGDPSNPAQFYLSK